MCFFSGSCRVAVLIVRTVSTLSFRFVSYRYAVSSDSGTLGIQNFGGNIWLSKLNFRLGESKNTRLLNPNAGATAIYTSADENRVTLSANRVGESNSLYALYTCSVFDSIYTFGSFLLLLFIFLGLASNRFTYSLFLRVGE